MHDSRQNGQSRDEGDEGELEVVSEWLDGAHVAAHGRLHEVSARLWERRVAPRVRWLRACCVVGIVAAALFVLLGGPVSLLAMLSTRLHPHIAAVTTAPNEPSLHANQVDGAHLPSTAANHPTVQVAPVSGTPGMAFACWVDDASGSHNSSHRVEFWTTSDNGVNWQRGSTPAYPATYCSLYADDARPGAALIALNATSSAPDSSASACSLPALFYTPDSGHTWHAVPWPRDVVPQCQPRFAVNDGHIYVSVWASGALLPSGDHPLETPALALTTDDLGASWRPADTGLNEIVFLVIGLRPGGRVLAETDGAEAPGARELWQSFDAGAHWQSAGMLPGANAQVYVSSDPAETTHGGWGRLYAFAASEANGTASSPGHDFLATAFLGGGWTPLPLPPESIPVSDDPLGGHIMLLDVGPRDDLLVARGAPVFGAQIFSPPHFLWLLDELHHRWLLDQVVQPANTFVAGTSSYRGSMAIWAMTIQLQFILPNAVLQVRLIPPQAAR